jgi:carboxy-terminal domain RNA polymerase II polypeptide A small phosphatase
MVLAQNKDGIVLSEQKPKDLGKKTLVLDLDETLVHSSFQTSGAYDLLLPVEIEDQTWHVYVLKRPGVETFLKKMAEIYEIVIYTASLSKYADPLLDWLDPDGLWSHRLFREHWTFYNGIFVKDLSRLDRSLKDTIIIDNSPVSYLMHPECALPITSWYDDIEDTELYMLTPILQGMSKLNDIRTIIKSIVFEDKVLFNKANQILQGGRVGERSHSQQPALRNTKKVIFLSHL